MSTTTFRRLLDDAAIFPPGLAPVDIAVSEHRALTTGPDADLIGPLLIGTGVVEELVDVVTSQDTAADPGGQALDVTLIARPGTTLSALADAVERVRSEAADTVTLTGVELPHSAEWRTALEWGLPLAVEVDREAEAVIGHLTELADAAAKGLPVRAKLRTQSTPRAPLPDTSVLGRFIVWCVRARLPFKLTGGLHHAAPTQGEAPDGGTETQHGLLNVMLATELADAAIWGTAAAPGHGAAAAHPPGGAGSADAEGATLLERVIATLEQTDATDLAQRLADLPEDRVSALRSHFTSYGCCGVLDPIGELTTLGLLPPQSTDTAPTDDTSRTDDKDN